MTEQADFSQQPQPQPVPGLREPAPKQGKGCFFWGCLICVIIAVLFVGCIGFCGFMAYKQLMDYTATEPMEIPAVEVQPGQAEEIQARVQSFESAPPGQGETLEITADDLNALVNGSEELSGHVFFRIDDDVLRAEVSYPLDAIPLFGGRYFNGELSLRPRIVGGQPVFDVERIRVGEKEIPPEQFGQILTQAVSDLLRDPNADLGVLQSAQSLEVRDGKIILQR